MRFRGHHAHNLLARRQSFYAITESKTALLIQGNGSSTGTGEKEEKKEDKTTNNDNEKKSKKKILIIMTE